MLEACSAHWVATEPSSRLAKPPRPREPTTRTSSGVAVSRRPQAGLLWVSIGTTSTLLSAGRVSSSSCRSQARAATSYAGRPGVAGTGAGRSVLSQACAATSGQPSRRAASRPQRRAERELGEPSTPTTTRRNVFTVGPCAGTTITGQAAWCSTYAVAEPSTALATAPWPWLPTTSRPASTEARTSSRPGSPSPASTCTCAEPPGCLVRACASRPSATTSATASLSWAMVAAPYGMPGAPPSHTEEVQACTTRSRRPFASACCRARSSAHPEDTVSSIPTTMSSTAHILSQIRRSMPQPAADRSESKGGRAMDLSSRG